MIPPLFDEVEVSFFGPGYGEAIAVHIGCGEWILIDSCIDTKTQEPRSLRYLNDIGVDVAEQVKFIIASHWHDDHVRGLRQLVKACAKAEFACAAALSRDEFLGYAAANASLVMPKMARSTEEINSVLDILDERNACPNYLGADRTLYQSKAPPNTAVIALSPSDMTIHKFIKRLAMSLPEPGDKPTRTDKVNPNDLSVVLLIRTPVANILLGGDLEEHGAEGWTSILNKSQTSFGSSSLFKIPHHGSSNAHCDRVWTEMLGTNPTAAIIPWRNGGKSLPQAEDVARILSFAPKTFCSANPASLAPYKRIDEVEKQMRIAGITISQGKPREGHLQFRKKPTDADWVVKMGGTARRLQSIQLA